MPRQKTLTMPELAQLVNANTAMKRRLAAAVCELFPPEDGDALEERLFETLGMACDAMVQSQGEQRPAVRYRVTCRDCELDRVVEITVDPRNVGLTVSCCLCGGRSSFALPEGDAKIACSHCGQVTEVERIKTTA